MILRRTFLALALSSLALSAPLPSSAAIPAEEFVKAKQEQLTQLLKRGSSDAEVDKVFDQVLDYRVLAQGALADHWAERTDAERDEFTALLSKLVRASYRKNLRKTLGYAVNYVGTEKGQDGMVVRTVAKSIKDARQEPLSIDYVVRGEGAARRIVDIVTEGSSLVRNYRSSFNRIMKKGGFPEVLKRMRKKAASGSGAAD